MALIPQHPTISPIDHREIKYLDGLIKGDRHCELNDKLTFYKRYNIDLDTILIYERPLFVICVDNCILECMRVLSNHNININAQTQNGNSALQCACWHYRISCNNDEKKKYGQIIKYLIDCGANCNLKENDPCSPLFLLCRKHIMVDDSHTKDIIEIAGMLLDHGANRNDTDDKGKTAEQLAREQNYKLIADAIRDHETIPDTKSYIPEDQQYVSLT